MFQSNQTYLLKVKANAKMNRVEVYPDLLMIWVTAPARDGEANAAIIKLLKKELGIGVEIVSGFKSALKKIKILKV